MTPRATVSAVIFVAAALALVACGGGQPAPAPTSTPTTTSASVSALVVTPTALSVPVPTPAQAPAPTAPSAAASAATPTALSVPTQKSPPTSAPVPTPAPAPTPLPAAVLLPTSTPAAFPTPTPVSTQTSTPGPAASYLTAETPPCTPAPGSSVDPCEPGWKPLDATGAMIDVGAVPFGMEYFLEGTSGTFVSHLMLRGTYLPGTVRCVSGDRFRPPSYVGPNAFSYTGGAPIIKCYADVRVNAYVVGSGPSALTVEVQHFLYPDTWGEAETDEMKGVGNVL